MKTEHTLTLKRVLFTDGTKAFRVDEQITDEEFYSLVYGCTLPQVVVAKAFTDVLERVQARLGKSFEQYLSWAVDVDAREDY